ncbi:MAG: tetratricopeptide repeat protein [Anaerolineales bacterium]|nr:tetratricopeptide repeat protein [Anaerolineales bacterium]
MPTLDDGRNAINQGNFQQARLIFEAILQENPRSEEAWLGLADVLTDTEDKRICYENVLKINKQNRVAREGLRSLEPEEDQLRKAFGLQQTPTSREEMAAEEEDEPTMVSPPLEAESAEEGQTPTMILVAVGLALSVVVMAVGGGLAFYIITNLTSG